MWGTSRNPNFREFSTPPPPPHPNKSWISSSSSSTSRPSPKTPNSYYFHVVHKVPNGDSPYVKAKHVQLIDKDPNKAISLFWNAINAGDRVDSAVKDMAIVMKQLDRTDEAIEAIRSFRHLCTPHSQESLDNVLIDLYKRGGRMREHIQLLEHKVRLIEEGIAFGGRTTKLSRSQGKKLHVSLEQEKSRLLGNLAWAYMQESNYGIAEEVYRRALSIEPDKNKQCNLAICLMYRRKIAEAKSLLQAATPSPEEREMEDPFIKSFDRAYKMLTEIEKNPALNLHDYKEETEADTCRSLTSPISYKRKSVKKLSFSQQFEDRIDPPEYDKGPRIGERRLEEGVDCQSSQLLKNGKSWADMVEEEEEELLRECTNATMSTFKYPYQESPVTFETPCKTVDIGNSENTDPNTNAITPGCPMSLAAETQRDYYTQDIQRKHKLVDLEEEQAKSLKNNSQRALFYEKSDSTKFFRPSPLRKKALFKSEDDASAVPIRNRLKVFQDITLQNRPRV